MSSFNASAIATSISNEFFSVDGDVRISKRGVSRLAGVSHTAINVYVTRNKLETLEVIKPLETAKGATRKLETLNLEDAGRCIQYYAFESTEVSVHSQKTARDIFLAFAVRGIQAWVKDVLNLSVDSTASNATINALVGIYPGLEHLTASQTEGSEVYLSVRQYLLEVKKIGNDIAKFQWFNKRLPAYASMTYQSLKQTSPSQRVVMGTHGYLCNIKTYLLSELPILDMAYEQLETQWTEFRHPNPNPTF